MKKHSDLTFKFRKHDFTRCFMRKRQSLRPCHTPHADLATPLPRRDHAESNPTLVACFAQERERCEKGSENEDERKRELEKKEKKKK